MRAQPAWPARLALVLLLLLLSAASLACLVFAFEALGHGLLEALPIGGLVLAGALFAWLYVMHARRCWT